MRLLLLRHAKAVPAAEAPTDTSRPLAARGERDARLIGERLRERGTRIDSIVTSPAARTLQTAQIVAAAHDYPRERIVVDERLYLAGPVEILAVIAAFDPTRRCVLVVGHNPGISELATALVPELGDTDLPTCGLVALDAASHDWANLHDTPVRIAYRDSPKDAWPPAMIP
ncbi:MAG TPA: histidine phosphatase family protein [Gammaproteobacteria bacterium]|nr:histidine phosphatase family protein [Gammaproteobacteria bacterium]